MFILKVHCGCGFNLATHEVTDTELALKQPLRLSFDDILHQSRIHAEKTGHQVEFHGTILKE